MYFGWNHRCEANLTGPRSSVFLIIIIEADAPSHFFTHFPLHPSHVPPLFISRFIHHTCHLCSFPASSITRVTCVHFPLHPSHVSPVFISRFIHHTCHLCSFPASSITRVTCVHFPLHDSSAA